MGTFNADVDKWEISRKRITLEEVIGSGSFGTVWRAVLSSGNGQPGIQFVAAKCFTPTSGEEGHKSIMKEIGLGKELGDRPRENVVQFIGCVTSQIHPILIMEYLPCGDLLGFLRKSRGIVDKYYRGEGEVANLKTYELVSFSNQIATGMVFLASRGIIHRDLAARNVLLDRNCVCKVADFGLYYHNFKYGHGNAKKGCVPVKWTAPEVLYGNIANLSSKSDVWSFGVVLYEIFTMAFCPISRRHLEGVILEGLRLKKKSRAGYASVVTTKSNEIVALLADDRNRQEVKEKQQEAHYDYANEIHDADGVVQCQLYLDKKEKKFSTSRQKIADWITVAEDKLLAVSLQVDSNVKPNDSISCAGTPTPSRRSKHSSSVISRGSHTSSVALARAKEAARAVELKAEIAKLEKRQALEEKKSRLQQEESRLNLEAAIAKTSAKERGFAALTTPSL
ncbi:tyrosine kinase receptor Cad96Ca-like [Acropora muricata]|uniref:tyrosine kinase receptor Cad96Ca-like n=1 Tax=Acropora muricata TaxID=159855 RepID=UPI0034E42239